MFDDAGFEALELDFTDALLLAVEDELFEVELFAVALLDFAVEADEVFLEDEDLTTLELDLALLALDFFTDELEAFSSCESLEALGFTSSLSQDINVIDIANDNKPRNLGKRLFRITFRPVPH